MPISNPHLFSVLLDHIARNDHRTYCDISGYETGGSVLQFVDNYPSAGHLLPRVSTLDASIFLHVCGRSWRHVYFIFPLRPANIPQTHTAEVNRGVSVESGFCERINCKTMKRVYARASHTFTVQHTQSQRHAERAPHVGLFTECKWAGSNKVTVV